MADLNSLLQSLAKVNPTLKSNSLENALKSNYGMRVDSTPKANGYFGPLPDLGGKTATEISIGVNFDGKEQLIPSLVPTLDSDEVKYLTSGGKPTRQIVDKAVQFARQRIANGLSPFASNNEVPYGIRTNILP